MQEVSKGECIIMGDFNHKIANKQTMWKVYRRTRKNDDYINDKEALNAATNEIRPSKRSYEQKLACNINIDSIQT